MNLCLSFLKYLHNGPLRAPAQSPRKLPDGQHLPPPLCLLQVHVTALQKAEQQREAQNGCPYPTFSIKLHKYTQTFSAAKVWHWAF